MVVGYNTKLTKIITIAVARFAPHPYSAILLSDYLLSRDAQQLLVGKLDREGVRRDVESRHPEVRAANYAVLNPNTAGRQGSAAHRRFEQIVK